MRNRILLLAGSLLAAESMLLLDLPLVLKGLAVLVIGGLAPGFLFVEVVLDRRHTGATLFERSLYVLGAAYFFLILVPLLVSYLPGPLSAWQLQAAFLTTSALLAVLLWWQERRESGAGGATATPATMPDDRLPPGERRWALAGLLIVLLVAAFLRLSQLGYAEFHGDEARSTLRAAAVIQGYDDVLMLHRKAPGEILLPASVFSLAGRLDEASGRILFAVANLGALAAVFLLGWRMLGPVAGWSAALLLALDGYFIAFSRFVQYQSVVLLLSVLAVLIAYRIYANQQAARRYLTLAAVFLATGLLGHYDALLALLPFTFLLAATLWQRRLPWRAMVHALWPGLLAALAIVGTFYLPFILHPNFQATLHYLWRGRIHGQLDFPYNNLSDFFLRSAVYSSSYFVLTMIGLAALALVAAYQRGLPRPWSRVAGAVVLLVLALTFWRSDWLKFGRLDLTVVPFTLAIGGVWFLPRLTTAERTLWIWFGAPLLAAMFLIVGPKTHVHIFFIPWALLAGGVLALGWTWLARRMGQRPATAAGIGVVLGAVAIFGGYGYQMFADAEAERLLNWDSRQPAGYWMPAPVDDLDSFYGFPLNNGWKAAGALFAEGTIAGDYDTNQSFDWISSWYTRGQFRCDADAGWYFAIDGLEPWIPRATQVEDGVEAAGFNPWGVVDLNGAPRMTVYARNGSLEVKTLPLDAYAKQFDAAATPGFPLDYPTVEPAPTLSLDANLENLVHLEGYTIDAPTPVRPGDRVELTLFWRAQQSLQESFKVFNQVRSDAGAMVAQQDSLPVCNRHPTRGWRPGELVVDRRTLQIAPDAAPGSYPLYTGMYREETGARLNVLDPTGAPIGNEVQLGAIEVADDTE